MSLPTTMKAVKLVGHGGIEQLVWDDAFPLRSPGSDEVVVKVGAAGVNTRAFKVPGRLFRVAQRRAARPVVVALDAQARPRKLFLRARRRVLVGAAPL